MYHREVQLYATAIGLSVLGSLGGLLTASAFLLLGDNIRVRLVPWFITYAVGTLLGVSLLALLPEALAHLPPTAALGTLLGGVLMFFLLEKLVIWRHCHDGHECELHTSSAASLVIIGDAFHTFVDGALIAAAVVTSPHLGLTTALAVAAHEIPQEVGDFAILLHFGYSRGRALLLNVLSAAASGAGAIAAFFAFELMPRIAPYFLVLAAASFLYVAMADLIPGLHRGRTDAGSLRQILLIAAGIATMLVI